MGQKFYKMPDKKTLKSMKDYYKKEQFLSDFKYGRIKKPSIDGAKFFYNDKELLNKIGVYVLCSDESSRRKKIAHKVMRLLAKFGGSKE